MITSGFLLFTRGRESDVESSLIRVYPVSSGCHLILVDVLQYSNVVFQFSMIDFLWLI